ncbi:MAG: MarR family transcriptional regulator [Clostridia bacterium]|nr:MarR family transcriptional regulator [Clostridia bacterium]
MHKEFLRASKYIQKVYDRLCEKISLKYGLTKLELAVLMYLEVNPDCSTARDITMNFHISKSAISQAIDVLMKKGFICGKQNENDRRYVFLELQESAKEILKESDKVNEEFRQIVSKGISEEELEAFQSTVKHMLKNIKEASKEITE